MQTFGFDYFIMFNVYMLHSLHLEQKLLLGLN